MPKYKRKVAINDKPNCANIQSGESHRPAYPQKPFTIQQQKSRSYKHQQIHYSKPRHHKNIECFAWLAPRKPFKENNVNAHERIKEIDKAKMILTGIGK